MKSPTRSASLLMAAIVTLAIPALADSVCACTTGNTGVGIDGVNAAVARITQTSPAFPSPSFGDEVIQSGSPAAVTYKIAFLDRNGEQEFETPVLAASNPQQLLAVDILRPDGSFVTQNDGIAVPTANGCQLQQVVRTTTTAGTIKSGVPQIEPPQLGIGWILLSWDDVVPGNGIVSCNFLANFNSGSETPVGVYTVRPTVINGILSPPQVSGTSFRMLPIGYGQSQSVTTTVFDVQALTTTVGATNGTIDFGAIKPGEIALNMGGIKLTPGGDVVVMNQEASQPANLMVTMVATDLVQNGTDVPVGDTFAAPGARAYAPIPCDRFAIAMEREPTPNDAMVKGQGASCQTKIFDNVPTLFPGQQIRFNAGILDPGRGTSNWAFAAGKYVGTLNVCLTGPGGQGDPITIGEAPVNPIPAFNADLTQYVDEVGPIQTAA